MVKVEKNRKKVDLIVAHMRHILFMKRHPLHHTFWKALIPIKVKVRDIGPLNAAARRVVDSIVIDLLPTVVKHYGTFRNNFFGRRLRLALNRLGEQSLIDGFFRMFANRFKKEVLFRDACPLVFSEAFVAQ